MKKVILILLLTGATALAAVAQNVSNSTATQSAKLVMSNAIEISFNSNGSNEGSTVDLQFQTVNDFANGVESSPIELKVKSNKKFHVWAKASSNRFTYSGNTTPAPRMNVNKLKIKVVSNNTGGTVPNAVNNKYKNMRKGNRKLINNGTPGGDNTFAVQYKADPGYEFPAGTYTVDVIYTATQK